MIGIKNGDRRVLYRATFPTRVAMSPVHTDLNGLYSVPVRTGIGDSGTDVICFPLPSPRYYTSLHSPAHLAECCREAMHLYAGVGVPPGAPEKLDMMRDLGVMRSRVLC